MTHSYKRNGDEGIEILNVLMTIKNTYITSAIKYSGIYMIFNKVTNKYYIGSAIRLDLRKYQHLSDLGRNKHKNKHLQSAFNKYGVDSFEFYVVEIVDNKDIILSREQHWLDFFNACDRKFGYNKAVTAGSQLGFKHSQETKKRISELQIGKKISEETKQKMRESNSGYKSYWYGKKLTDEHIENIKKGRKVWIVNDETKAKMSNSAKGKKKSPEAIEKSAVHRRKSVVQHSSDGKFIKEWPSIISASNELSLNSKNISSCCKGIRKTCGGFKWSYKEVDGINV